MKGAGLSAQPGKAPELRGSPHPARPRMAPSVSGPSHRCCKQKWPILGWLGHLLELFKEGHSGLGALQGELQGSREESERGAGFQLFHDRMPSCLPD